MNIKQMMMNQLQTQLKAINPQAFNQFEQMKNGGINPQEFLQQMTGKYTPEQMKKFTDMVNGFGISNDQLRQFGINTK